VKSDIKHQERDGAKIGPADDIPANASSRIRDVAKRICRVLEVDGYARIDFRLGADGVPYFIEANPNPEIARSQEYAQSAAHDGLEYPDLITRILALAIARTGVEAE
jgi:D-alanine-D-alanine ligase